MAAAVELTNVTKRYQPHEPPAVDEISLAIESGEFFSILGPSGSGKSTTLRMIAGLEAPSDGAISLTGVDVSRVPAYRRNVNTVFQSYALFPHMRVDENVAYPLKMRRVPKSQIKDRVTEMVGRVGLEGLEHRKPLELSGGQRQRVALARALVGHPPVLLLDEPLGALDLKLRETMLVMLKRLQRDLGITFVYVTHDQGEALAMSDRVAVMNHGKVEQVAPPLELYARPGTAFVAAFIGKTNLLACRVVADDRLGWSDLEIAGPTPSGAKDVTLSLRPEAVVVGEAARALPNSFDGRVSEVLFLGHEHEIRIAVGNGVLTARSPASVAVQRDDPVVVGWAPESAVPVATDGKGG
jgi:spermidine/putrescine transport system ATP-binding protein